MCGCLGGVCGFVSCRYTWSGGWQAIRPVYLPHALVVPNNDGSGWATVEGTFSFVSFTLNPPWSLPHVGARQLPSASVFSIALLQDTIAEPDRCWTPGRWYRVQWWAGAVVVARHARGHCLGVFGVHVQQPPLFRFRWIQLGFIMV